MSQSENAGLDPALAPVKQRHGTEAVLLEMWKRGAAGVELQDTLAEVEALNVRVAGHDDIGRHIRQVGAPQILDWPVLGLHIVHHHEPPPVQLENLLVLDAAVDDPVVVVAAGSEDRCDLLQTIENQRVHDIAGVENQVNPTKRDVDLIPERDAAVGHMRVRDYANPHRSTLQVPLSK